MKGSKLVRFAAILILVSCAILVAEVWVYHRHMDRPGDLRYRQNESICAHQGINPFHVWNRDVFPEGFKGISRPDKPYDKDPDKIAVHAYPPWHVSYTWIYADIPFGYLTAMFFMLDGLILGLLYGKIKQLEPETERFFYWSWIAFSLLPSVAGNIAWGNYGIFLAGLMMLLLWALESNRQILAGVAWALMMSKPQVATLLFFPLLFQRKFTAILVAISICVVATMWPAYVYGESPIDLILQIPQIGSPYETNIIIKKLLPTAMKSFVKYGWMALNIVLCGWFSWKWRNIESMMYRFVPFAFFFPFWTYCNGQDLVCRWVLAIMLALVISNLLVDRRTKLWIMGYICIQFITCIFIGFWSMSQFGLFSADGIGWLYHALTYPADISNYAFAIFVLVKGPEMVGIGRTRE